MLIVRNGVYKDVTEQKYEDVFKERGYTIAAPKPKGRLSEKEQLIKKAEELKLKIPQNATVNKLKEMIAKA